MAFPESIAQPAESEAQPEGIAINKVGPVPGQVCTEERWTPCRHPQPKDPPLELVVPNVIPEDELAEPEQPAQQPSP